MQIRLGKYRHFKGKEYEVIGLAKHSETLEEMVVYRALYGEGGIWVRPEKMWEEEVLFEGKDFGLIVDYRGLIQKLDSAMEVYSGAGLEDFDSADIQGVIVDVMACVSRLREAYSHLCDLFVSIKNKEDTEYVLYFDDFENTSLSLYCCIA